MTVIVVGDLSFCQIGFCSMKQWFGWLPIETLAVFSEYQNVLEKKSVPGFLVKEDSFDFGGIRESLVVKGD